jgi:hypothetical protein
MWRGQAHDAADTRNRSMIVPPDSVHENPHGAYAASAVTVLLTGCSADACGREDAAQSSWKE